ncbi:uncharacterized protein LOC143504299 [Brachyhypopomus gauderio]|uniref:uncharacterized protein LOC143504299 n=1 Tax=Brachyhypopomus gauderio TaxID=698409 RepID=UPI004041F608
MMEPHNSSSGGGTSDPKVQRALSRAHSRESKKSHWSRKKPPALSNGLVTSVVRSQKTEPQRETPPIPSCVSMKSDWSMDYPPGFSSGPVTSNPQARLGFLSGCWSFPLGLVESNISWCTVLVYLGELGVKLDHQQASQFRLGQPAELSEGCEFFSGASSSHIC